MKLDVECKGPEDHSPEVKRKVMNIIYRDTMDEILDNIPETRGKIEQVNLYVDADHAENKVTRRSQIGILIFLRMAPIFRYSKKKNTCESYIFGSEYVVLKIAAEKTNNSEV